MSEEHFNLEQFLEIFQEAFSDVPANYLSTDPECQNIEELFPGVSDEFVSQVYTASGIDFSDSTCDNTAAIKAVHAIMDQIDADPELVQKSIGAYAQLLKFYVGYLDDRIAGGG
jgi:hypothetical protein